MPISLILFIMIRGFCWRNRLEVRRTHRLAESELRDYHATPRSPSFSRRNQLESSSLIAPNFITISTMSTKFYDEKPLLGKDAEFVEDQSGRGCGEKVRFFESSRSLSCLNEEEIAPY